MKNQKYATRGHTTHGLSRLPDGKPHPLHKIWCQVRQRCFNQNDKDYVNYGGRGIAFDESWNDFAVFYEWAMGNGYQSGLSIERKNNDGNYEPSNCKWIPMGQQRRNNRRILMITFNGKTQILSDWAKEIPVKYSTLYARLKKGLKLSEVFKITIGEDVK